MTEMLYGDSNRRRPWRPVIWPSLLTVCLLGTNTGCQAVEEKPNNNTSSVQKTDEIPAPETSVADEQALSQTSKNWQRWFPDESCWFDLKRKAVIVDGQVCQRTALLEMFACPTDTKDHESIVSVDCHAATIHAYLLVVGAQPGNPVQYQPEYQPADGTEVSVFVQWVDENGTAQECPAQQWIRHVETGQAMEHDWVFAGSEFWKDEDDQEHYLAEGGDLICVSNFPTATLDVPVASSQDNASLQYEPFSERIPKRGTKVRLILQPKSAATDDHSDEDGPTNGD